MTGHTYHQPLPLSYRSELMHQLMPSLHAGESCQIIGVSGSGKSNLGRFLLRCDVQEHYWHSDHLWPVLIDTHSLGLSERSLEYEVYETMVHQIVEEIHRRELAPDAISWADGLHADLLHDHSAYLARRTLGRLCTTLASAHHVRIIFVFDQFDRLWRSASPSLFLSLRHLRDELKYHVVYLVQTRNHLHHTRDDLLAVEDFAELFSAHCYGLGPYSARDAHTMLERLSARSGVHLDAYTVRTSLHASGGHASLLRAVYWALHQGHTPGHTLEDLLTLPTVGDECDKVWQDLTVDERHLAHHLATGHADIHEHAHALAGLRLKGLAHAELSELMVPLLHRYAAHQIEPAQHGVHINARQRTVTRDGVPLGRTLSPLEFNLLAYLASRSGEVCRRDEILNALYQEEALDTNDERLDTLVRRLRVALDDDARRPRYLVTHRGVGFQMLHAQFYG